jgi:GNAT superfamily N-acetyltransferase
MPQELATLSLGVRNSAAADLKAVLEWTGWRLDQVLPAATRTGAIARVLHHGRFRSLCAVEDRRMIGVSMVSPAPEASAIMWKLPNGRLVPASECLHWVALVVHPARRQQGIGRSLFESTLNVALSTGYPYVLATYPRSCDATALFGQMGFAPAQGVPDQAGEARTCFMRETRLASDTPRRRSSD